MLCINLEDQCATVLGSYIQFYTPANSFPSFIKQGFFFVLAHSPATQRYFFRLLQWFSFSCGYCWMHDYLRLSFHMSLLYHLLLQPRVLSKVVFQTHKISFMLCLQSSSPTLHFSSLWSRRLALPISTAPAQCLQMGLKWRWFILFRRFRLFKFISSPLFCRKMSYLRMHFLPGFSAVIAPCIFSEDILSTTFKTCKCFLQHVVLPASLLTS